MINRATTIRVGYRDTDKMQVVHHSVYAVYFEIARTSLLRDLGAVYADMERRGVMLPLMEYGVVMRSPARYDDLLLVTASIGIPSGARLRLEYTIQRGTELLVSGYTLHAFTTVDTMRPVRPPREFLQMLERWDDQYRAE